MITEEERQEIINAAVEKTLLTLPEVVGNLIMNQVTLARMNKEFYSKYPEFRNNKDVVRSMVELVEGNNPGLSYDDILTKAVPMIRETIRKVGTLNTTNVSRPTRNLDSVDLGDL